MNKQKPRIAVLSPDSENWSECLNENVSYRNLENSLCFVFTSDKKVGVDAITEEIEKVFTIYESLEVEPVNKKSVRSLTKKIFYYTAQITIYNAFKLPDDYDN